MSRQTYTILITPEPDDSGYNVTVPALPGCLTFGTTVEEAMTMARDAIGLWLESLAAHGETIPVETKAPYLAVVAVNIPESVAVGA